MGVGAAIAGAGALGAVGAVASSAIAGSAAKSAAATQAAAADRASAASLAMYNRTREDLAPYNLAGTAATKAYSNALGLPGYTNENAGNTGTTSGSLVQPFQPTIAQLEATPGYQFSLDQGLKSVQNSYAANGLGGSGAALKAGINYATGLAGTTYQQQFNNYWTQNKEIGNLLNNQSQLGELAAAQTGQIGQGAQNSANQAALSGAAATAAGTVGAANATAAGIGGVTSSLGNAGLLLALNAKGLFGGTGGNVDNTTRIA